MGRWTRPKCSPLRSASLSVRAFGHSCRKLSGRQQPRCRQRAQHRPRQAPMGRGVVFRRPRDAQGTRTDASRSGHLRVGRTTRITDVVWSGEKDGSFFPMVDHATGSDWTISVWTYGRLEVQFQNLAREHAFSSAHPFASEERRRELLGHLNAIPGVSIPEDAIGRRPGIPLSVFVVPGALEQFLEVLDWLVDQLRGEGERAAPGGDTIGTLARGVIRLIVTAGVAGWSNTRSPSGVHGDPAHLQWGKRFAQPSATRRAVHAATVASRTSSGTAGFATVLASSATRWDAQGLGQELPTLLVARSLRLLEVAHRSPSCCGPEADFGMNLDDAFLQLPESLRR